MTANRSFVDANTIYKHLLVIQYSPSGGKKNFLADHKNRLIKLNVHQYRYVSKLYVEHTFMSTRNLHKTLCAAFFYFIIDSISLCFKSLAREVWNRTKQNV